jgi:TonB family protein
MKLLFLTLFLLISLCPLHAQKAPEAKPPILEPGGTIKPPVPVNHVEPQYPSKARLLLREGTCVLSMIVDRDGMPQNLSLVKCSDSVFEQNAMEAAGKYRFRPARNQKDDPVAVQIRVEVVFRLRDPMTKPFSPIKYILETPAGATSSNPDKDGVYPLSHAIDPPQMTKFGDQGFVDAAGGLRDGAGCDVLFTVTDKGKVKDPEVVDCDEKQLEVPAVESLLKTEFKPGKLNRKSVAVRAVIHLAIDRTLQ